MADAAATSPLRLPPFHVIKPSYTALHDTLMNIRDRLDYDVVARLIASLHGATVAEERFGSEYQGTYIAVLRRSDNNFVVVSTSYTFHSGCIGLDEGRLATLVAAMQEDATVATRDTLLTELRARRSDVSAEFTQWLTHVDKALCH